MAVERLLHAGLRSAARAWPQRRSASRDLASRVPQRAQRLSQMGAGKAATSLESTGNDGSFQRKDSEHRDWVKAGSQYPPAAGRYHLYISWACPWASRCAAALYLKGLDGAIGLSATHPTWQKTRPDDPQDTHWGWTFASDSDEPFSNANGQGKIKPRTGLLPDTINNARTVRDLYDKAGSKAEKFTVPVLWDKQTGSIVNNESSDILRMLSADFNEFAGNPGLDLYPEPLRGAIDEANAWVYPQINNGVYRAGFATSQQAYEAAFQEVFEGLDKAEGILAKQRWLVGDALTEADIRLFVTLVRFDHVYETYFKCNRAFIHQYPALKAYVSEVYQMPEVQRSVNLEHIMQHYNTSHPKLNYYAIVPKGPKEWFREPHTRAQLA